MHAWWAARMQSPANKYTTQKRDFVFEAEHTNHYVERPQYIGIKNVIQALRKLYHPDEMRYLFGTGGPICYVYAVRTALLHR